VEVVVVCNSPPSPKSQTYDVIIPKVDLLVDALKATTCLFTEEVNLAIGRTVGNVTVYVTGKLGANKSSVTINVIVKVPA